MPKIKPWIPSQRKLGFFFELFFITPQAAALKAAPIIFLWPKKIDSYKSMSISLKHIVARKGVPTIEVQIFWGSSGSCHLRKERA